MSIKNNFSYFKYNYINFVPLIQEIDNYIKEHTYISARTFNWSIIKIAENIYLYAVRYIARFSDNAKKFKPGNSIECTNPMEIGFDYWWNKWSMANNMGGTYFFVGNHLKGKFKHCDIELDDDIKKSTLRNRNTYNSLRGKTNLKLEDIRLIVKSIGTTNSQYWLHDDEMNYIYPFRLNGNTIIIGKAIENKDYNGRNYAIISLTENELQYIDWYYVEGIKIISKKIIEKKYPIRDNIVDITETSDLTEKWIPYDHLVENGKKKYIISGNGSYDTKKPEDMEKYGYNYGKMPLFSFGTPHIGLTSDGRVQLGVGHVKIHTDPEQFPYLNGSRIQTFRTALHTDMKAVFGDRYIRHKGTGNPPDCYGYIYMLYFYILDGVTDMRLSDAYLPVYLDPKAPDSLKDADYKFSLIFPMGLAKYDNDKIIVTCGEGDFYSVALEFDIKEVVNSCIHNVKRMDMDQYGYKIIAYKNGKHYVGEKLSEIIQFGGKNYYYKYLKYKTKYLKYKTKYLNTKNK